MSGRLQGEQFHSIRGSLTFSEASACVRALPGAETDGSFTVYGPQGCSAEGFVLSSATTMRVLTEEFAGPSDVIAWRFDGTPYRAGETVEGFFRIISNQGEYRLPFTVRVENAPPVVSPAPGFDDAEGRAPDSPFSFLDFTNLARRSFKDAAALFYTQEFPEVFRQEKDGEELQAIYEGLSVSPGNAQNVEEFLISAGRKAAIEYLPETAEIRTDLNARTPYSRTGAGGAADGTRYEYYFRLLRNGWGYTELEISSDSAFLIPAKRRITQEDFEGQSVEIHYYVDPSALHFGRNFGGIRIRGAWCDLTVPVEVSQRTATMRPDYLNRRELAQIRSRIVSCYIDFRTKKLRGKEWMPQTEFLVDRMLRISEDDPMAALLKVHCHITAGRQRDAAWALADFDRRVEETLDIPSYSDPEHRRLEKEDPLLYSYRVYLGAICADEENAMTAYGAAEHLGEELRRYPDDWRIAWLWMYCSAELGRNPRSKWELLRDQFERGSRSPVLYVEAWRLLRRNPEFIASLDEFELQVLYFTARRGLLSEGIVSQVNLLAGRRKGYSALLLRVLTAAYEENIFVTETLRSICSLLIRGNMTTPQSCAWYRLGVKEELSLTRLFEFYMLSLPEDYDGEIPRAVLLYFGYQCTLPYDKTAQLYRYVHQHRSRYAREYEQQYRAAMEEFALAQLTRRRVSPDLCYLYEHVLDNTTLNRDNAQAAAVCIFACSFATPRRDLVRLVLRYDHCCREQSFAAPDGRCTAPVYGDAVHVFWEDAAGNRYRASAEADRRRLARYEDLAPLLAAYDIDDLYYTLYQAERPAAWERVNALTLPRFAVLSGAEELREENRAALRRELLHYYEEHDLTRDMDSFLLRQQPEHFSAAERGELLFYLVQRGHNRMALDWVSRFGTFGAEPSVLMRLFDRVLAGEQWEAGRDGADAHLAELIHEVFVRGKYNEKLLLYMEYGFEGLTAELDEIRWAAERFGTDTAPLLTRLVTQLLYTGVVLKSAEEILGEAERAGLPEAMQAALLAQMSHYYFVGELDFGRAVFDRIAEYGRRGTPLTDVCRMAFLLHLSRRSGEMTEEELSVAKLFLSDLLCRNIVFPFYRRFAGLLPGLQEYADETIMQFRGKSGAPMILHYVIDRDASAGAASGSAADTQYQVLPMKEMYDGIYVVGFVLFFGEQVRYYITDDAAQLNTIESGAFGQDTRIPDAGEDRFSRINRISMYTAMGRYEEALEALSEYDRRAYMVESLFGKQGS